MPIIVKLKNVRLAFPQIFEAKPFQGQGEASFTASVLIDPVKQAAAIKDVQEGIIAAAKEKWGTKAEVVLKSLKGTDKICLRDGNMKSDYSGFENMMFISTRTKKKPYIVDKDAVTLLTAADGRPYGGCYVNASIELWGQDNGYGKRINASLRGLQFYKDGDAFAGGAPVDPSEFDSVEDFGETEPASNAAESLF